jgi:hypothetical protein
LDLENGKRHFFKEDKNSLALRLREKGKKKVIFLCSASLEGIEQKNSI